MNVLEWRISASGNDAEEFADGTMYLGSSDLELVEDGADRQTVGMRWQQLAIPHGATIVHAWIQFTSKASQSGPTDLEFAAADTDDAGPFRGTAFDISSRPVTAAVEWVPGPWAAGEAEAAERTPDLASVIQAIVSGTDWSPGNALTIIVRGSGVRTAWAWDGDAPAAPLLHVEYMDGDAIPSPSTWPIALYAGYFDTHHLGQPQPKPDPWLGSPGVVFAGNPDSTGGWDTSCLRFDNLSWDDIDSVVVSVDMGVFHYALWSPQTIPAHGTLIVAQTSFENFDGSDTNAAGCPTCDPSLCLTKVSSAVPIISVKVGSTTTHYYDHDQVLNTKGVDAAGCPYTGFRDDESHPWAMVPPEGLVAGVPPNTPTAVMLAAPVPNPARGSVMLGFSLPVSGRVQLGVYDLAGRLVRTCLDADLEAGQYLRGLDLAGVQPGVYFGILRAPGGVARRSLVVAR